MEQINRYHSNTKRIGHLFQYNEREESNPSLKRRGIRLPAPPSVGTGAGRQGPRAQRGASGARSGQAVGTTARIAAGDLTSWLAEVTSSNPEQSFQ
jgi:hypothetical protein